MKTNTLSQWLHFLLRFFCCFLPFIFLRVAPLLSRSALSLHFQLTRLCQGNYGHNPPTCSVTSLSLAHRSQTIPLCCKKLIRNGFFWVSDKQQRFSSSWPIDPLSILSESLYSLNENGANPADRRHFCCTRAARGGGLMAFVELSRLNTRKAGKCQLFEEVRQKLHFSTLCSTLPPILLSPP